MYGTLARPFQRAARLKAGGEATVDGLVRRTWGDVHARLGALGASLERLGIPSGEVVGILAHNSGAHLEAWLGIPAHGRVINEHPDVAEAAVFGVPDERWRERVHSVLVLRSGASPGDKTLVEPAPSRIAAHKAPRSVEIRPSPFRSRAPARSSSASCASRTGPAIRVRCTEREECPLLACKRSRAAMPTRPATISAAVRGRRPSRRIHA
jgi:acyl-CoA synthetase (AMP-forming)/AMP-acid ligase II